ncbi:hypothetical protein D3OALGA1CA_2747 [Olavius algarvensis associated proteobacterium Delta 3]|nr:hypothetical protein D3OALGA1CA_2747 [Olavius algarvensis associated proteobacterium Delta 3]
MDWDKLPRYSSLWGKFVSEIIKYIVKWGRVFRSATSTSETSSHHLMSSFHS